jgi:hypothetical protein
VWGALEYRGLCKACRVFAANHPQGECAGCQRLLALKKGYCRLCWAQASLEAKGHLTHGLAPYLAAIRHHQLFFASMRRAMMRRGHPPRRRYPRPWPAPAPAAQPLVPAGVQLRLFDRLSRDLRGFDRARHADLANPWLVRARRVADARAEALGWPHQLRRAVDRALVVLLSGLEPGERVRFSEVAQMRTRHLPIERTAEVLAELGLLDDDRRPRFEDWLQRNLRGLAAGIRRDVEAWLRVLHDGAPRSKPRSPEAVWSYCAGARPALLEWSARYQHLREVTRDDVRAALDLLHGQQRARAHVALRSLFRFCKRRGLLFGDPTSRIRLPRPPARVLLPLDQAHLDEAVAAATTPEERLVLALAAVHAARRVDICTLTLDDVDLGNRRLVINGRSRRLDDLTRQALLDYLAYRRARWPSTANPHLLISRHTANETGPISTGRLGGLFCGITATLGRLRVDRQLEELLAWGPDPLHLAAVFGVSEKTGIRYAAAARQVLESAAEHQAPSETES